MTEEPLGSHVLELQLAAVVEETADARSLVFKVPDGSAIPAERLRYAPGQFLTLRVPSERTGSVARCYSLCSSPFTDDSLTVTVKRTDGGYASNWLCDNAHPGMHIHVLAPSGTFVPKTLDTDFLLLAAGSGITPMMAILKSALSEGSGKVALVYANRDEKSVIFAAALRDLAAKYPDRLTVVHWLETVQGLPSAVALGGLVGTTPAAKPSSADPARSWWPPSKRLKAAGAPSERPRRGVQVAGVRPVRRRWSADDPTTAARGLPRRSSRSTERLTRSVGPATPSFSTSCSTRASTLRSPAAKVIAAHVRC